MVRRIVFKPKTPFSALFTADQIWGQFIWAVSDIKGESAATDMARLYANNEGPVLFSSAMVDGYLPKPLHVDALADFSNPNEKSNKKCKWLSYRDFYSLQRDSNYLKRQTEPLLLDGNCAVNSIQEIHVTVSSQDLFNVTYMDTNSNLVVYVSLSDEKWISLLTEVIEYWKIVGLGGDRSVGRGQFDIFFENLSDMEKEIFDYSSDSGFISISQTFGADLIPVYYNVEVYSGFVGRKNQMGGVYRKKSVVRYLPGSFFKKGKGSVAKTVNDCLDIYSYGLAFPVYMEVADD